MSNYKIKLHKIKAFAFDVDGVLTDGSLLVTPEGDLLRTHNVRDGFAIRMAVLNDYPIAIITAGNSVSTTKRFNELGVKEIYQKAKNKIVALQDYCNKYNLMPEEILYVGDDLPDMEVLKKCGVSVCPSDAANEVKEICDYISSYSGGRGCVRDAIEQVLKCQGKWVFNVDVFAK